VIAGHWMRRALRSMSTREGARESGADGEGGETRGSLGEAKE